MKINNSTKKSLLIIALAMASTTYQTQAAPIEHIGDRYIMHIPEMELTGEESLLDVLMMCPEVISLDGNNIIGGDPFANLYGKFVIRIDNQEYGLDYATFLHHFKAREIETIKVCQNAEVMKGCSSLKKVIDITLRKKENGTTGRWGLFGDTYGGAKGIVSVISQQDKLRVLSHVEGNFQRTSSSKLYRTLHLYPGSKAKYDAHQYTKNWIKYFDNVVEDLEPTGIHSVTLDKKPGNAAIYDLNGRRITEAMKKGVYIKNGKKISAK
jgi:hypothetical protein